MILSCFFDSCAWIIHLFKSMPICIQLFSLLPQFPLSLLLARCFIVDYLSLSFVSLFGPCLFLGFSSYKNPLSTVIVLSRWSTHMLVGFQPSFFFGYKPASTVFFLHCFLWESTNPIVVGGTIKAGYWSVLIEIVLDTIFLRF